MLPYSIQPVMRCKILLLFGGLLLACVPATAQEDLQSQEPAGIARLKAIEERVLPLPLVRGVPLHEKISDYYWDANVGLRFRLDEALRAFTTGKPPRYRAMTIVAGTAGIGKTFVKKGVYQYWVPDEELWKFDIRDLFGELAERGLAVMKPDVYYDDHVINRLLSLTPEGRSEFSRLLESNRSAFVIVDSLDEVHPDDYDFVLRELEKIALHGDRKFIHVVVFGRPLAFRTYWRDRRSAGLPDGLRGYVLFPPEFRTTGDLLVSSWNYDCWKYDLTRVGFDGQVRPMTFPDFLHWCDRGFPTSGEFADVDYAENESICPKNRDELENWLKRHRVVASVLPNLAGNSMLREIVDDHVREGKEYDERQFMDEFFEKWLERDTKSDDRPSRLKPQYLDLYLQLLEEVAAKYIRENRVSRLGYFDVVDEDLVVVEHEWGTVSVPVKRLLNRSGLVSLDPLLPVASRYRFEPFWFHRLLLTMQCERQTRENSNDP